MKFKKFLSTTLAAVMLASQLVLPSATPVAMAAKADDDAYLSIGANAIDNGGTYENSCFTMNIKTPIAAGQTISFEYKPLDDTDFDSVSVRSYSHTEKWFDVKSSGSVEYRGTETNSLAPVKSSITVTDLGDGWKKVSWTVGAANTAGTATTDGFWIRFSWKESAGYSVFGDIRMAVDNLTVGSKVCSFNKSNLVSDSTPASVPFTFKFDDGTQFTSSRSEGHHTVTAEIIDSSYVVPATTGITISSKTLSGQEGGIAKLTCELAPAGALDTVTWSTDNPSVATVESSGKVNFVGVGNATITVTTASGFSDSCAVTVTARPSVPPMDDEKCYAMSEPNTTRNKAKVYGVSANDELSYYVKPIAGTATSVNNADMYTRAGGTLATYVSTGNNVYSGQHIRNNAEDMGNGWYYIVCSCPVDGDYDVFIDAGNMDGTLGQSFIGGFRINGVEVGEENLGGVTPNGTIGNPQQQAAATPTPVPVAWENQTYTGTLPSQYTTNLEPYQWQINTAKGGVTNLPAVVTAATGMYTNITNQNDALREALQTVKFKDPNNMIFFISDGFGPNMVKITEAYSEDMILNDLPNHGESVTRSYAQADNLTAVPQTGSLSYVTTDSGAGGGALSTGYKTRYKNQGLDKDGYPVPEINEVLREQQGKIIGVVTTGWAYDSTPADFGGCHATRGESAKIAEQMMKFSPDLMIGYGLDDYTSTYNSLKGTTLAGQNIGWYANWSSAMKDTTSDKMWINMSTNVVYNERFSTTNPTISQMMAYSLAFLQKKSLANDDVGFYMMFENGMTDSAGHGEHRNSSENKDEQKAAQRADDRVRSIRVIGETRATNEAMCIALKFACENPDTIVILTADHDTGGLTLNNGWETNFAQCKYKTTGHSDQNVDVFAIGKGTELFNGQVLENCQVGKLSAFLMGIDPHEFGTQEAQWSIDEIIAGGQQYIQPDVEAVNKIEGKALHIQASDAADQMTITLKGAGVKAHGMYEMAIKVPAGATKLDVYGNSVAAENSLLTQSLDKFLNYVDEYDQYQLTFKPDSDVSDLVIVVSGSFNAKDEVIIDSIVADTPIDFEDFDLANLAVVEEVKAGLTAADVLETISFYPTALTAEVGDSRKVAVTFDTGLSTGVTIDWAIDNEAVATIAGDKTGVTVTIASEGSAVVTATLSNGIVETFVVTGNPAGSAIEGDVNCDGVKDDDDAIYLLFHCFFEDQYPVKQDCDFNDDGFVDDDDAIYLLFNCFFPERYVLHPLKKEPV